MNSFRRILDSQVSFAAAKRSGSTECKQFQSVALIPLLIGAALRMRSLLSSHMGPIPQNLHLIRRG